MGLNKQAQMEKRAAMEEFIRDAKQQLFVKYNGSKVNRALQEVMQEDMAEMVKEAFPHDDPPNIAVEIVGTAAVRFRVRW